MFQKLVDKLAALTGLGAKTAKIVLMVVAAILLLVIMVAVWWFIAPHVSPRVWLAFAGIVVGLFLVWLIFRGIPRYLENRFMNKHRGDLAPGQQADEKEPLARMTARLEEAETTWVDSPNYDKIKQPLYWIPWYMVLGDESSPPESFLRLGMASSPFPPPVRNKDQDYLVWWFHKDVVTLEMSTRFVCDTADKVNRGIWYQALRLIRGSRSKLPLNGFVLLVSADKLASANKEDVREYALRLRRMLDEAQSQLQVVAPVYVVVTDTDKLLGGDSFFAKFPPASFSQVFGHLFEGRKSSEEAWRNTKPAFEAISTRLHALRLNLLAQEQDPLVRKGIYDFVTTFTAMSEGLEAFTQVLFDSTAFHQRPFWRGMFFLGSTSPKSFCADLLLKFLPADQPLASRTQRGKFFGLLGVATGLVFLFGGAALMVGLMSNAYNEDRSVIAKATGACSELAAAAQGPARLDQLFKCRTEILGLEEANSKRSLTFAISSAKREEEQLKGIYGGAFSKWVVAAADQDIETKLAQKKTEFGSFLGLNQRIALASLCSSDKTKCLAQATLTNVSFEPRPASGAGNIKPDEKVSQDILQAFLSYLMWHDADALKKETAKARQLLTNSLALAKPTVADAVEWATPRYPAITSSALWRPGQRPAPAVAGAPVSENEVPAAFTRDIWDKVLGFFINNLDASAAQSGAGAAFQQAYGVAYSDSWRSFSRQFPDGISVWDGSYRDLLASVGNGDNPYARFWPVLQKNVLEMPLDTVKKSAWAVAVANSLKSDVKAGEPVYAKVAAMAAKDPDGQESFQFARAVYATTEGPAANPAQEFLKSLKTLENPKPEDNAALKPEDHVAWRVAQGPARLTLELLTFKTVTYLEKEWQTQVVQAMKAMDPKSQVAFLLGPNGKIKWFMDSWLNGFLGAKDGLPVVKMGVRLRLNANFQAYIVEADKDRAKLQTGPFNAAQISVSPSALGGDKEGVDGTVFELVCQSQKFAASSTGSSLAETRVSIFWSPTACDDVRIKVALPGPAGSGGLTKTYSGQNGFTDFLKDFKTGSKAFKLSDFASSYTPTQWKDINEKAQTAKVSSVRVMIAVKPTPELEMYLSGPKMPPMKLGQEL